MKPSTRTIVLSVFVSALLLTAGCSAFQDSTGSESDLLVANQDSDGHAVVVEILDGGSRVYSTGQTIDGESDAELASFDRSGEYEVQVTVDGTTTVLTHTFESERSTATIGIDNQGNVTIGT